MANISSTTREAAAKVIAGDHRLIEFFGGDDGRISPAALDSAIERMGFPETDLDSPLREEPSTYYARKAYELMSQDGYAADNRAAARSVIDGDARYKRAFNRDSNPDISEAELSAAMTEMGSPSGSAKARKQFYKAGAEGVALGQEAMDQGVRLITSRPELAAAFDTDGDGKVSQQEATVQLKAIVGSRANLSTISRGEEALEKLADAAKAKPSGVAKALATGSGIGAAATLGLGAILLNPVLIGIGAFLMVLFAVVFTVNANQNKAYDEAQNAASKALLDAKQALDKSVQVAKPASARVEQPVGAKAGEGLKAPDLAAAKGSTLR